MKYSIEHTTEELNKVINALQLELGMDYSAYINKEDGAIHVLYKGEEDIADDIVGKLFTICNNYEIPASLSQSGGEVTLYFDRVSTLFWLKEDPSHYIINFDYEEEVLRELLALPDASLDKLSQVYNYLTGKEVIDHRDTSEYSNVNAQADVDFYAEEPIVEQSFKQTIL